MDRDNRWERVEKAYRAMTEGAGESADGAAQAVQQSYAQGTDHLKSNVHILPAIPWPQLIPINHKDDCYGYARRPAIPNP